jgi:hypothetical protein
MPTKNPRLTLTLTPTTAAQLRRISELTGNSQASLISELLEGQEIVFAKVIHALELAESAKTNMKQSLFDDMERSQQLIEKQIGLALDTFDAGLAPLIREAEAVKRRRPRARAGVDAAAAAPARNLGNRARQDPHLLTGGSK